MKVVDLDVLRPEKRVIKLSGNEIDVSFIPCGITFDVDAIMQEIAGLDQQAVKAGGAEARKAFDLSISLCVAFCAWEHPDLNEKWFRGNVSPQQLGAMSEVIQEALLQAYAGIETPQKAAKIQKAK